MCANTFLFRSGSESDCRTNSLPDRVLLEFKCELMDTYGSLSHVHHIETRRQVVLPQYSLQMRREAEQMVFTRTIALAMPEWTHYVKLSGINGHVEWSARKRCTLSSVLNVVGRQLHLQH